MNKNVVRFATVLILAFSLVLAFGQNVSEAAKVHFDRGAAAQKAAKSKDDYLSAGRCYLNYYENRSR
jgi:hypothetical protein